MGSGLRFLRSVLLSFLLSGCWNGNDIPLAVDQWLFQLTGSTIFAGPERLTLKEIHLDNGTLVGRQVIVEGVVEDISPVGTFLVISDHSARLLVVLTDVGHILGVLPKKAEPLLVFGSIESGKKGLPFVRAWALRRSSGVPIEGGPPSGVGST